LAAPSCQPRRYPAVCHADTPSQAASRAHPQTRASATTTPSSWPAAPCWPPAPRQHNGYRLLISPDLCKNRSWRGRSVDRRGGQPLLPMLCVRAGSLPTHYLGDLFDDKGKALALYTPDALASPAHRIVLHATDRGCTFPRLHRARLSPAQSTTTTISTNPVPDVNHSALRGRGGGGGGGLGGGGVGWVGGLAGRSRPPPPHALPCDQPAKTSRRHRLDPTGRL